MSRTTGPLLDAKRCTQCGETKPLSEFHKRTNVKDGRASACRACISASCATWRATHQEYNRARQRVYYADDRNREKRRATNARWVQENTERKRASERAYRERHRERVLARDRERAATPSQRALRRKRYLAERLQSIASATAWRKANLVRHAANQAARRARGLSRDGGGDDAREYAMILRNDPCSYCGSAAGVVDHIRPLARDGTGAYGNLTAACRDCNARKSALPLLDFMVVLRS